MSDFESDTDDDIEPTIIIDNGSGIIKVGFMTDKDPQIIASNNVYVKKILHQTNYPIEHGIVVDWDDMEKVWNHIFYEKLNILPEEHPVLLTQTTLNPKANREKMQQIMFETFNCPGVHIEYQSILVLYSLGIQTGIVLNSGFGVTSTVPIYKGYLLPHATLKNEFGGNELTKYLHQIINNNNFNQINDINIVNNIKETLTYIAFDYQNELKQLNKMKKSIKYRFPDGNVIDLNDERIKCGELLFNPTSISAKYDGIHTMLYKSIMKCDSDIQKDLFQNIVLSGGNTTFNGFDRRLYKEIKTLATKSMKIYIHNNTVSKIDLINGYLKHNINKYIYSDITKIIFNNLYNSRERKHNVWIGGSILCSTSQFQDMVVAKDEYDESGPGILIRKLF